MSDDLSLLLKIRGENAQAKATVAETRAAIATLRSTTVTDFNAMQSAGQNALKGIGDSLNVFIGQRIPLVGGAFVRITENLHGLGAESGKSGPALKAFDNTIADLSKTTGKSSSELTKFLGEFVKLPNATDRGIAGFIAFGSKFEELEPKLEAAGKEMVNLAAVTPEAAGGLAGVLAAMGPVGIAAAGIAVEVAALGLAFVAVVKVGESVAEMFFGLAKSAADFRGKMLDMSQQTGVSVETLSALEVAAARVGTSIEGIVAPLGIFQKHLEDAQDPSTAIAKRFDELGVSTDNTEEALRQTLKTLAAMPEGFHQTALALELFGRGGRTFLAILKETNGDLDGAIDKLKELGVVITREDAEAADKFNDQLALLQFQFRALVGKEAIPAATKALEELSRFLQENRGAVNALGAAIHIFGLGLEGMILNVTRGAEAINSFAQVTLRSVPGLTDLALLYERIAKAAGLIGQSETAASAAISAAARAFRGNAGGGTLPTEHESNAQDAAIAKERADAAKKRATEAQKNAETEIDILRIASQEAQRIAEFDTEGLRQQFEQRKLNLQQYTDAVIELAGKELKARQDVTNAEREQADLLPARQRRVELARIALQEEKDQDAFVLASAKAREAQQKQEAASELALNKQLVSIRDAQREGELQRIQDALDRQAIAESTAIERRMKIEKEAFNDRMMLIDIELGRTKEIVQAREEINRITVELNANVKGLIQAGNIDIINRPQVKNLDGTVSTVRSISVEVENLGEVLIPTVSETGKLLTNLEAIAEFKRTGKHLGIFSDAEAATEFAQRLHEQQAKIVELRKIADKASTISAEHETELNNKKIESEQRFTDAFRRLTEQRIDAMNAEHANAARLQQVDEFNPNNVQVPIDQIGPPPELTSAMIIQAAAAKDAFTGLGTAISETLGLGAQAGEIFGNVLANAFGSLAQAVGSAVQAFVLFGGAGIGLRKFTATLIAEIAKMAAVQAVWELAQGLAMLALNFFWPDPKLAASAAAHFHAAAIYGGLAVVAAGVGRAVAGGSFAQSSGGGGGGGGSRPDAARPPSPIDLQRPQQREEIHIFLHPEEGLTVKQIERNVSNNGSLRHLIINVANS